MDKDATRKSLLSAIKDPENRRAWQEFYDLYAGFIRAMASHPAKGLEPSEVDDVVQAVFVEIAKNRLNYDPKRGNFRSLLKTVTDRRAIDQLRRRTPDQKRRVRRAADDSRQTNTLDRIAVPANREMADQSEAEWLNAVLHLACKAVKVLVKPKQFQIFEAYVLRKWPVEKIVKSLNVTAGQVYTAKQRIGPIFEKEAKLAAKRLDAPAIPPLPGMGMV